MIDTCLVEFSKSDKDSCSAGILSKDDRQILNKNAKEKGYHTKSFYINNSDQKEIFLYKYPIPLTESKPTILKEFAFLINIKNFKNHLTNIDTFKTFIEMTYGEKKLQKLEKFLFYFSFEYSNHYQSIKNHRDKISLEVSKIIDQRVADIKNFSSTNNFKCPKTIFIPKNHGKTFVRFDMISAVSSVIGIPKWNIFMKKYTKIELYQESKSLRGKIMGNTNHKICMNVVSQKILKFITDMIDCGISPDSLVSMANDEVIFLFEENICYSQIKSNIDNVNAFKMEIFKLENIKFMDSTFYLETHINGEKNLKCVPLNRRKDILEYMNLIK